MKKNMIKMNTFSCSMEELLPRFVASKTAQGVSEKTIKNYHSHFHCIGKHIDLSTPIGELTQEMMDNMVVSMRNSELSHNSISSYMRVFRTFMKWCRLNGYTTLEGPKIKYRETLKDTYSDDELRVLLKRPKGNCDFSEYRTWVIINFLVNCGCRAATIRNIHTEDVDLKNRQVFFRHTKTGRVQVVPLGSSLVVILAEYMEVRGGEGKDYLFPNDYGEMLTESALRTSVFSYNKRRGIQKTSIHMFRHTFARKYLVDCGGDAFTLQRLLGHSTLEMTKHYCAIFDSDLARNYDRFSPLEQLTREKEKIRVRR